MNYTIVDNIVKNKVTRKKVELGDRVIDDLTGEEVTIIGFQENNSIGGFSVYVDHGRFNGYRHPFELSTIKRIKKLPPVNFDFILNHT